MTFRELREKAGFSTRRRLAIVADVNAATVDKIETGKVADPRYSTICALAQAMGVHMAVVKRSIDETVKAA
jgi:transcriptional regulator with XRE-family HTH domain